MANPMSNPRNPLAQLREDILPFLSMAWRRRWLGLIAAWLVACFGWLAVAFMPNDYVASTRVYVDTRSLLSPLLKGMAVNVDLNEQLLIMQRTLLSRPNLEQVIRSTDLDLQATTPTEQEALIKKIEKATTVRAEGSNLFFVSYESTDPQLSKRVVQSLLNIFVEGNLGASRRDMEQARQFIDEQIARYEVQLRESEQRLAEFKQRNIEMLPESGRASLLLEQARNKLREMRGYLYEAETRRATLARQLAETQQFLSLQSAPQVVISQMAESLDGQVLAAERDLAGLRLRYTEKHPDVIVAQRRLDDLRAQRDAAPPSQRVVRQNQSLPNPVYEQVQLRFYEAEAALQTAQRQVAEQESEVTRLEAIAADSPAVEAEFSALNRDYDVIKANYEQLLERRESARLSQEIDSTADQSVRFRIVDPPQAPLQASGPNRMLLNAGVFIAALGAGIGVCFVLAQLGDAFGNARQLRESFAFPVLGGLSTVRNAAARARGRVDFLAFSGGVALLVTTSGFVLLYAGSKAASVLTNLRTIVG